MVLYARFDERLVRTPAVFEWHRPCKCPIELGRNVLPHNISVSFNDKPYLTQILFRTKKTEFVPKLDLVVYI